MEGRLVAAAGRGDLPAQRELFERYRTVAYRVAHRITRREADALDVVQDAFIKAFERLANFKGDSRFKTWLLRIVTNRALDIVRQRKVRLAVSLSGGDDASIDPPAERGVVSPSERLEREELAVRAKAALDRLPPDQRAVLALYATGEMTYGEIAEVLDIPPGTVMSRLYHARRKMQEMLSE